MDQWEVIQDKIIRFQIELKNFKKLDYAELEWDKKKIWDTIKQGFIFLYLKDYKKMVGGLATLKGRLDEVGHWKDNPLSTKLRAKQDEHKEQ